MKLVKWSVLALLALCVMLGLGVDLQAATSSIPEEVTSASTAIQAFALTIVGVVATIAIAFVGLSYVKRLKKG